MRTFYRKQTRYDRLLEAYHERDLELALDLANAFIKNAGPSESYHREFAEHVLEVIKGRLPLTPGFWEHLTAEDFKEGSDDYFEQYCIDCHGAGVMDNTRAQRVAIGRDIEANGFEG